MKGVIISLLFLALLCAAVSAATVDIFFNEPVKDVYNLGDIVNTPLTISSPSDISGTLKINLICDGVQTNLLTWEDFPLETGYPKIIPYSFRLVKEKINDTQEKCNIQAAFGIDSSNVKVSNDFKISDWLYVEGNIKKEEFDAGEEIIIDGKAIRETGENSEGFVEALIITNESEGLTQISTISNGMFVLSLALPDDLKAGVYSLSIKAYEKDSNGLVTNEGTIEKSIYVKQVPTNIELSFDSMEISPKEPLKVKAVVHDQTGEVINSTLFITLKDLSERIVEQREIASGEIFEYSFKRNEPPSEWMIYAVSGELNAEGDFRIKENEEISIEIMNKTILITNIGNIPYNKTLLVKVGDSPLNIALSLNIGESKKYIVQAPDGEYEVVVFEGEKEISQTMGLTGKAIGIKEVSGISLKGVLWIFLILGLMGLTGLFFKKTYKKPFLGRIKEAMHSEKKEKFTKMEAGEDSKMVPELGSKAELSLSIKGEQQDASVACIRMGNLHNIRSKKGSGQETLKKIIDEAKDSKAVIYENNDYLFLMLVPSRTRTFKNEKPALDLANKIKEMLDSHNRTFNEKIDFGISLHYGTIVGKQEGNIFKFMTMGSLVTVCKKIASMSEGEVLLSEKINDLLRLHIKTEKSIRDGMPVFSVKEVKREADEATKKFINRFMERQKKK